MPGVKGKSGRKRLPKVVKELSGTFRKDQHNEDEPQLAAYTKAPGCPRKFTGEARKTWQRVATLLTRMGVLTEADLDAVSAYTRIFTRWEEAESQLSTYGVMLSKGGSLFPSPYLRIAEDCLKQRRAWMNEFGITPSSRSRVRVDKPPKQNDKDNWFGITGDSRN